MPSALASAAAHFWGTVAVSSAAEWAMCANTALSWTPDDRLQIKSCSAPGCWAPLSCRLSCWCSGPAQRQHKAGLSTSHWWPWGKSSKCAGGGGPWSGLTPILRELLSAELLPFGPYLVPLCWAVEPFTWSQLVWGAERPVSARSLVLPGTVPHTLPVLLYGFPAPVPAAVVFGSSSAPCVSSVMTPSALQSRSRDPWVLPCHTPCFVTYLAFVHS